MSRFRELGQPGFTVFWEDLDVYVQCLNDEQLGRVMRALWSEYYDAPYRPDLTQAEDVAFYQLMQKVHAQCDKYETACARNRENGKKNRKSCL